MNQSKFRIGLGAAIDSKGLPRGTEDVPGLDLEIHFACVEEALGTGPRPDSCADVLAESDANGDGSIDGAEYTARSVSAATERFAELDLDDDSVLDRGELELASSDAKPVRAARRTASQACVAEQDA